MVVNFPKPHPGQVRVRSEARRINWLFGGRRWRKTTLCARLAIETMLAGQRCAWAAPTHPQSREGWDEAERACSVLIGEKLVKFNKSDQRAIFRPNGGIIDFRSLEEPDNARGLTANRIILEEMGEIQGAAWEVLRPTIIDTHGDVFGIGTPKGITWAKEQYDAVQRQIERGEQTDHMAWRVPTLGAEIVDDPNDPLKRTLLRKQHPYENPYIDWSELQGMWADMTERSFRQEVLCEFIADAGGVFSNVEAAAVLPPHDTPFDRRHRYQIGVDLARKLDYTVISVVDLDTFQQVYLRRFNQVSWELAEQRVVQALEAYPGARIVVDSTGVGDVIYDNLFNRGIDVYPFNFGGSTNKKAQLVDWCAAHIEKGRLKIWNSDIQTDELQGYQYETTAFGSKRMSAPKGHHDDTVIALCLAVWEQRAPEIESSYLNFSVGKPSVFSQINHLDRRTGTLLQPGAW